MKELDFKLYLVKNFKLTYTNLDWINYIAQLNDYKIEIIVTFNDCKGKVLPLIQIRDYNKETLNYYQSFKKALNKILKIVKEEGIK